MNRRQRAAAEARSAEFERLVAEANADLAEMRQPKVAAIATTSSPAPDVDALVEQALAKREAERELADAEAWFAMARCPTGACACCGLEAISVVDEEGRRSPGWHSDPDGAGSVCEFCWRDLYEDAHFATKHDRRIGAIRMLLAERTLTLRAMADPAAFAAIKVFWFEHDAPPVQDPADRWRHVDVAALREQYEATATPTAELPPDLAKPITTPCPRCGVVRWRADWEPTTYQGADTNWEPVSTGMRFCQRCAACGGEPTDRPEPAREPIQISGRPQASDVDELVARLLGVRESVYSGGPSPIPGLALRTRFKWFWQLRGDRHHRRPSAEPWAHLDFDRMRHRAGQQAVR